MSLSKREFKIEGEAVVFDPMALGDWLVDFVLLMGSGRDGRIPPGGDLDLAIGMRGRLTFELRGRIAKVAGRLASEVDVDVGRFDGTEPVYRFEALKGRLLFTRDEARFQDAFSLACREYESQMRDYERQAAYRLKRKAVAA